jgi:hypothetical protein
MFKLRRVFHKKNDQCEIRLFNLEHISISNILKMYNKIIMLMNLQDKSFVGTIIINDSSKPLQGLSMINEHINVSIYEESKNTIRYELKFKGELLIYLLDFILANDITLYLCQNDENNNYSDIELLLNDRDFWSLSFNRNHYDSNLIYKEFEKIRRDLCEE